MKHILQDEVYLGHMVQGKTKKVSHKVKKRMVVEKEKQFRMENTHEPIISLDLYEQVQATFQMDVRVSVSPFQNVVYPLSGFVRCGDCGMSMTRKISGKKSQYVYYVCSTHKATPSACPTTHSIQEDKLLSIVLSSLHQRIQQALDMDTALTEVRSQSKKSTLSIGIGQDLRAAQKELEKWIERQDTLYDDYKDGLIPTREDYERQRARYIERISEQKQRINQLKKEQYELSRIISTGDSFVSKFRQYESVEEISREVLAALVKKIIVHGNGNTQKIQITFHFEEELRRVQQWLQENQTPPPDAQIAI